MLKIKNYLLAHKIWSGVGLIIVILIGYWLAKSFGGKSGQTQYVLAAVTRGTLVASITGTGQVSGANQVDLKSKASGDVVYVGVRSGQGVAAGTVIAQIDSRDADASLENAKISLAKLTKAPDAVTLIQTQNDLASANNNLVKAYRDGFNDVTSAIVDLGNSDSGLNDLLESRAGFLNQTSVGALANQTANNYRNQAERSYYLANDKYNALLAEYKTTTLASASSSIETLIADAYNASILTTQAIKDSKLTIEFLSQNNTSAAAQSAAETTAQTNVDAWSGQIGTDLANLAAAKTGIESGKSDLAAKTAALIKLQNGADPLDIQSAQLAVTQAENNYENYFIRAPFDGVVGNLTIMKGDNLSSGTVVATMVTSQKLAEISLNEVDAAKVKVGDKATLTFDAVPDLTISGQVSELDEVGTVTQGVVTYGVKIAFDTNDTRVKPGMSVSAAIITDLKQNTLMVPNSAVKTQGAASYVQMFDKTAGTAGQTITAATAPINQTVQTGLVNDTETEIISGLNEGDLVVSRTITGTATAATSATAPSLFGGGGGRAAGGAAVRFGG